MPMPHHDGKAVWAEPRLIHEEWASPRRILPFLSCCFFPVRLFREPSVLQVIRRKAIKRFHWNPTMDKDKLAKSQIIDPLASLLPSVGFRLRRLAEDVGVYPPRQPVVFLN